MTMEEEMSRYITKKGNVWSASIIVLARQKFLGYFRDEESARLAFESAYQQRESGLGSDKTVPGTVTGTSTSMAQGKILSKFKGKISKDVKLSDGSFISDEFYRFFDENSLIRDIQSLLMPQQVARNFLSEWITTYNQPPSFAVLHGKDADIHIPALACVLGRMNSELQPLFDRLGMQSSGASGLIFDFNKPNPIGGAEGRPSSVCCIHVAWDECIAKSHAMVRFNSTTGKFEIQALATAGLFLNGNAIKPNHGFIPLNSKTIVQLGRQVFIFLLPQRKEFASAKKDHLLALRRNVLRCLVESIRLRNGVALESSINSDLKIQKLETLETQTVLGVSLTRDGFTAAAEGKPVAPDAGSSALSQEQQAEAGVVDVTESGADRPRAAGGAKSSQTAQQPRTMKMEEDEPDEEAEGEEYDEEEVGEGDEEEEEDDEAGEYPEEGEEEDS